MVGLVPQEIFDASVNPFREETVEGWRFDAGRSLSLRVVCRRGAGWRLSPWMTGWFRRMWERGKSFMQTTVQSGRGQSLDVLVPQRQEELVGVPKIVFHDRIRQLTFEQFADSPIVVQELVFKHFPKDGVQQSFFKQNIEKISMFP